MDTYIVLAGGYWHMSKRTDMGGMQVDENDGDAKRTVDYIIKVKGLPDSFLKPVEIIRKNRFYCETCHRWIKEVEIEQKTGCFVAKEHKVRMEYRDIEAFETGVFDRYYIERQKWITPCIRIFLNHSKGISKWRDIWRYIEMTFPTTKRLKPEYMPVAVGTKNSWEVTESDVPVIDLSFAYRAEEVEEDLVNDWTTLKEWSKDSVVVTPQVKFVRPPEVKRGRPKKEDVVDETTMIPSPEMMKCDVCGISCKGAFGLRMHKFQKHKSDMAIPKPSEV